jgi:phosphoribosylglycinamide formyltransferase-1
MRADHRMQAAVPVSDDDTPDPWRRAFLIEEHRIYPDAIRRVTENLAHLDGRRVVFGRRA